ncbi:MAG TPA: hypothetical protein VHK00_00805 [Miltoncostaeaceae bacterium]|jgi:hypothetical protein|nr:hypothetical protein [Miltoncostaeaceae bacterium]
MRPPLAPSDDPTGGRTLTRRLKVVLPVALVGGLAVGIPVAVLLSDWRPAVVIPLVAAAIAGTVVAAIEDGRVQRRVDAATGPGTEAGLRAAWHAAHEDLDERAEAEVRRALLRGATPARIVRAIDHPRWTEERVRAIARAVEVPVSPPPGPPASP